ncbi:hypothetical protein [Clostridium sp. DL1XJH146]
MNNGFIFVLFVVGVLELVLAFVNEKILRKNYKDKKIKNLEGLIKWEKYSNLLIGVLIIIYGVIYLVDYTNPVINYYAPALAVIFGMSYFGRKRYI